MKDRLEWNLRDLYKSIDDPALEKDISKIERAYKRFASDYKDLNLASVNNLLKALVSYEKLYLLPKPLSYLFLLKSINTDNKKIDARIAALHERLVNASNQALFFELNLSRLSKEEQEKLLSTKKLEEYHYFLSRIFLSSKHLLSEKEEALFRILDLPSESMWIDLTERLVNSEVVDFNGNKIPLSEASNRISSLNTKDRRSLHKEIMEKLGTHSDVAEAEMNAVLTKKKISDSLRGYKKPYSETLLDFETTEKELKALRTAVGENITISQEFYDLKKNMLRLKQMTYADRNAEIGKINTTFDFKESREILGEVFSSLHPRFGEILDSMLRGGKIDVFPRRGKTSGAFCYGTTEFPTFVLLNHVDTYDSLSTFAHEMGHAIHSELSKEQRPLYERYSTATAEFASTLFEDLIFNAIFERLSKAEQRVLLHNRINRDISTIFRQMAFFEFEVELHEELRSSGYVPKEKIIELLNKHTGLYLGPAVEMSDIDGNFFVTLSHIRRFFYVYSYAYGSTMSRTVSERIKEDPDSIGQVIDLLSSGGSKSPKELFAAVGINTEKKQTYEIGLRSIKNDIDWLKDFR